MHLTEVHGKCVLIEAACTHSQLGSELTLPCNFVSPWFPQCSRKLCKEVTWKQNRGRECSCFGGFWLSYGNDSPEILKILFLMSLDFKANFYSLSWSRILSPWRAALDGILLSLAGKEDIFTHSFSCSPPHPTLPPFSRTEQDRFIYWGLLRAENLQKVPLFPLQVVGNLHEVKSLLLKETQDNIKTYTGYIRPRHLVQE